MSDKSNKIVLTPIAMVKINPNSIHAPSRVEPPIKVDEAAFIETCADNGRSVPVSFEKDGLSDPQLTTAYEIGGRPKSESKLGSWPGLYIRR